MNYIVFDLEWNQPIDGKSNTERKLAFEIIEIGAVKLDEKLNIISSFSEIVKPSVYRTLNWHTQKMLNIKMSDLKKGDSFKNVCSRFLEWCGEDVIFCSWGPQDLSELQRNMDYYKMEPLSNGPMAFYDVQKMYAMEMQEEGTTRKLELAVNNLKIDTDIPFHRAYSDAYYTAKVLAKLSKKTINNGISYDIYHLPESLKDEIFITQGKETYYLSKGYAERTSITDNRKILAFNCPLCKKRALRPKVRWYSTNSKVYHGAAICAIHGPLKGKLRIKKNEFGLYYAEKFLTYCTFKQIEEIKEKKRSIKASKKQSPGKENYNGENILREQISPNKKTT